MLRRAFLVALLGLPLLSGCSKAPDHYVASKKSQVFHRPDCSDAKRIEASHLLTFATRDEAIKAGYRPCDVCKP